MFVSLVNVLISLMLFLLGQCFSGQWYVTVANGILLWLFVLILMVSSSHLVLLCASGLNYINFSFIVYVSTFQFFKVCVSASYCFLVLLYFCHYCMVCVHYNQRCDVLTIWLLFKWWHVVIIAKGGIGEELPISNQLLQQYTSGSYMYRRDGYNQADSRLVSE